MPVVQDKNHSHTAGACTLKDLRALRVNCLWTAGAKNSSQRWGASPQAWNKVSVFAPLWAWALGLWGCVTAFSLHLDVIHRQWLQDSAVSCSHCTADFAIFPSHSGLLNDSFQQDSECSRDFHSSLWLTLYAPWPKRKSAERPKWSAVYRQQCFSQRAELKKEWLITGVLYLERNSQ